MSTGAETGGVGVVDRGAHSDGALQTADHAGLIGSDHRQHHALRTGAGGSSGAMQVGLGIVGGIEVDHAGNTVDVDAASGDVGRHQGPHPTIAECLESAGALRLAATTVDRLGATPNCSSFLASLSAP